MPLSDIEYTVAIEKYIGSAKKAMIIVRNREAATRIDGDIRHELVK